MTSPDPMLAAAFDRLAEGAGPGKSPYSMVYAATSGLDGRPRLRTVVMRRFDAETGAIWFNTDLRSPKAAELGADPRISILGYDRDAGFQIRVEGAATLHRDAPGKQTAWEASADRSRICYRHGYAPSSTLDTPELGDPTEAMRAPDDHEAGFENFGAVEVRMETIDILDLARSGHRRSFFKRTTDGWTGEWRAP